jgi:hypothetical protein
MELNDNEQNEQNIVIECYECGWELTKDNRNYNERKTKYKHEHLCDICYKQFLYNDNKN